MDRPWRWKPEHPWHHGRGIELPPSARVIYELHVGTFTPEGTFAAATERLPYLADLGVTVIELLPVSAFAGRWGWGYDGVAHFAPHAPYGIRTSSGHFVDEAHGLGWPRFWTSSTTTSGPRELSFGVQSGLLHPDIQTAWGDAPNFGIRPCATYVLDNARSG